MLRVRHTINTSKGVLLQFRDYKATANKIENSADDVNTGKWLCTFARPKSIFGKSGTVTLVISSKKEFTNEFKSFILSDFPKVESIKENPIIKVTNSTLTNISKLISKIRKSIEENEVVTVNTLINDTFSELNTLQSKIIELEKNKK